MNTCTLIITWKPNINTMVEHVGSYKGKFGKVNNFKGMTARSERESFKNIKNPGMAIDIVNRRNKKQILFATYDSEVIFTAPKEETTDSL